MNIRGIFFHVLGDALGNVGVMASALIIWLTPWSWRFYFDPAISLLITLIILKSALPLCRDTAKPLLQAVPKNISVEEIKEDIQPEFRTDGDQHLALSSGVDASFGNSTVTSTAAASSNDTDALRSRANGHGAVTGEGACLLEVESRECCGPGSGAASGTSTPKKSSDGENKKPKDGKHR